MPRVLLVDDLPSNLFALRAALVPLEAELVCADSGAAALAAAREGSFALAVLDVMMPGMDGLTLARELKALHPDLPIIFMTAHETASTLALDGYALGAVDYLTKPVDLRILRQKVAVFLQLQARTEQLLAEQARKTEERALRLRLEQQWTMLADLFAVAPVGVSVLSGPDHVAELLNPRFRELWRVEPTERRPLFELIPGARPWLAPALDAVLAERSAISITEASVGTSATSPRYVDLVAAPLLVADQGRICVFWFDVTERVLAYRAAETANSVKDAFLTMVSHELRTPLSAITGWASLLKTHRQRSPDEELVSKAVDVIERNARSQARIIEDILDASRMVRGTLAIEHAIIDLRSIVQQAVDAAAPEAARNGISLLVSPLGEEIPVSGDEVRLRQLIGNLLSNAMKFTPRGGRISVALERTADVVELSVTDSGIGIDPRLLSEIFIPFHQVDMSSTRRSKGVGLGLAIVRHIAELHGGGVRAFSEGPSTGTTMEVWLPVLPRGTPARTSQPPPPESFGAPLPSLGGARILVAEDGPDAREFFALALRSAGADVRVASSAEAAMAMLDEFAPHVLLSDLAMPDHDGFWLLEQVRAKLPSISAIAVSASMPPEFPDTNEARRFDDYVLKPVDERVLVRVVSSHVSASVKHD